MKKIIALSLLLLSTNVFAQKNSPNFSYSMAGIEGGFRWSSAEISGASSNKQDIGFQVGGSAVFDFAPSFGIKTGLLYTERPFKSDVLGTEVKGKITYFDIPAFFMFKFEEYAGVYLGPSFSFKLGDQVSPGSLTGIKSSVIPITLGAQFKFAPNMGVNIYFESMSGDMATGLSNARAVGANFLFTFD